MNKFAQSTHLSREERKRLDRKLLRHVNREADRVLRANRPIIRTEAKPREIAAIAVPLTYRKIREFEIPMNHRPAVNEAGEVELLDVEGHYRIRLGMIPDQAHMSGERLEIGYFVTFDLEYRKIRPIDRAAEPEGGWVSASAMLDPQTGKWFAVAPADKLLSLLNAVAPNWQAIGASEYQRGAVHRTCNSRFRCDRSH